MFEVLHHHCHYICYLLMLNLVSSPAADDHNYLTISQRRLSVPSFHLFRPDPFLSPPLPDSRSHPPPKHTHTFTLCHTPTTLYVSGRHGESDIKEPGTLEVEQKQNPWFSNPMTSCHQLHCTFSSSLLRISGWSELLRRFLSLSQTPIHTLLSLSARRDRSSGPALALLSQHAAPGGVSSSHGGPVQC